MSDEEFYQLYPKYFPEEYNRPYYLVEGSRDIYCCFGYKDTHFTFVSKTKMSDKDITIKEVDFPDLAILLGVDLNLQNMYNQAKIAFKGMLADEFEKLLSANNINYDSSVSMNWDDDD